MDAPEPAASGTPPHSDDAARDALAGRLFEAALGAFDLAALHVGERLGLYAALDGAALPPGELAAATGTAPRYVREWLEQQAVTGILAVDSRPPPRTSAGTRCRAVTGRSCCIPRALRSWLPWPGR